MYLSTKIAKIRFLFMWHFFETFGKLYTTVRAYKKKFSFSFSPSAEQVATQRRISRSRVRNLKIMNYHWLAAIMFYQSHRLWKFKYYQYSVQYLYILLPTSTTFHCFTHYLYLRCCGLWPFRYSFWTFPIQLKLVWPDSKFLFFSAFFLTFRPFVLFVRIFLCIFVSKFKIPNMNCRQKVVWVNYKNAIHCKYF